MSSPTKKSENKSKTILLIEDDEFLLNMYKTKLELEGYKVISATNGETALRAIKEKTPALVLLDIVLPKINGFEILKEIRSSSEFKDLPIIILTNLGQQDDIKKGLSLGANEYLIKAHFLPSEVLEKVKKFI